MAGVYADVSENVNTETVVKDIAVSSITKLVSNFIKLLNPRRDFTDEPIRKFN